MLWLLASIVLGALPLLASESPVDTRTVLEIGGGGLGSLLGILWMLERYGFLKRKNDTEEEPPVRTKSETLMTRGEIEEERRTDRIDELLDNCDELNWDVLAHIDDRFKSIEDSLGEIKKAVDEN